MSKKSNSLSIRLGIINLWFFTLQNYGNNFNYLFIYFYYYFHYIKHLIHLNKINIYFYEFFLIKNLFYLIIFLPIENKNHFKLVNSITNFLNKSNSLKINCTIYFKYNWFTTSFILKFYLFNLINKFNYSPKKILGFLFNFLFNFLNKSKISYLTIGSQELIFKGFKIQLKGRYENTKNKMAKSTNLKVGNKLSLININKNIYFLDCNLFSKLGSFSIRLLLFFTFK